MDEFTTKKIEILGDEDPCVECDGSGRVIDTSACGDPDHCDPEVPCSACKGSGWAYYDGEEWIYR